MSLIFPVKDTPLTIPKAKTVVLPKVFISASYDDECLVGKVPAPKRAAYEANFDKEFARRLKEVCGRLEGFFQDLAKHADQGLPNLDDDAVKKEVVSLQNELEHKARSLEVDLKGACQLSVLDAFKQTMLVPLGKRVVLGGTVKVAGKLKLTAEAADDLKSEAEAMAIAEKASAGIVLHIQEGGDAVAADSATIQPMAAKSIKDCNTAAKSMKAYASKKSPADEKIIDTTMKGLDKSLDTMEKLVSKSLTQTRQVKLKLAALDGLLKDLKRPDISNAIKLCVSDAQGILDILNGFQNTKPVMDAIGKPWDETKIPDFPKLITALNRLDDTGPSKKLVEHLDKMQGLIEGAATE